jgi:hypothetical protein
MLFSDLSAKLSACPVEEIDRQIESGLRRIAEGLALDLAGVWLFPDASEEVRLAH